LVNFFNITSKKSISEFEITTYILGFAHDLQEHFVLGKKKEAKKFSSLSSQKIPNPSPLFL
jgi:hypothetical protein